MARKSGLDSLAKSLLLGLAKEDPNAEDASFVDRAAAIEDDDCFPPVKRKPSSARNGERVSDKALVGPSPLRGRKGLVVEGTKSAGEYSADDLNAHLASGGVVQITTYTNSWVYDKRWAGKFFERDGDLYIRKGNRSEQLSSNGRMLVGIRKGRYGTKSYQWNGQGGQRVRILSGEFAGQSGTVQGQLPKHGGIGTKPSKFRDVYRVLIDGFPKPGGWHGIALIDADHLQKE